MKLNEEALQKASRNQISFIKHKNNFSNNKRKYSENRDKRSNSKMRQNTQHNKSKSDMMAINYYMPTNSNLESQENNIKSSSKQVTRIKKTYNASINLNYYENELSFYTADEIIAFANYKPKIITKRSEIISYKRGYTIHDFFMENDTERIALEYKPKLLLFYPHNGLSILENETNKKQVKYSIIRRGLRTIFKFEPYYLKFDNDYDNKIKSIQAFIIAPIFIELERAKKLKCHFFKILKINGFNCQISFDHLTKAWIIAVNTHSISFRDKNDLELVYTESRDVNLYLRRFCKYWILVLDHLKLNKIYEEFIIDIKGFTLIGNLVGSPIYYDLIKYKKEVVVFHSMVKNDCTEYFIEVYEAYKFFIKYDLFYSPLKYVDRVVIPFSELNYSSNRENILNVNKDVTCLDKLFILLIDLYHKEQARSMAKSDKGVMIHLYSYFIENTENYNDDKNLDYNINNNKDYDNIEKANNKILNSSYTNYEITLNKKKKKLMTVFQIENNEYNLFKKLHEEIFLTIKSINKEESFFGLHSEVYGKTFEKTIENLIDENSQFKKLPVNSDFYKDMIKESFSSCINKAKKIFNMPSFKKKMNCIIYDAAKTTLSKSQFKNYKFDGFTSHVFLRNNLDFNKMLEYDFLNNEEEQDKFDENNNVIYYSQSNKDDFFIKDDYDDQNNNGYTKYTKVSDISLNNLNKTIKQDFKLSNNNTNLNNEEEYIYNSNTSIINDNKIERSSISGSLKSYYREIIEEDYLKNIGSQKSINDIPEKEVLALKEELLRKSKISINDKTPENRNLCIINNDDSLASHNQSSRNNNDSSQINIVNLKSFKSNKNNNKIDCFPEDLNSDVYTSRVYKISSLTQRNEMNNIKTGNNGENIKNKIIKFSSNDKVISKLNIDKIYNNNTITNNNTNNNTKAFNSKTNLINKQVTLKDNELDKKGEEENISKGILKKQFTEKSILAESSKEERKNKHIVFKDGNNKSCFGDKKINKTSCCTIY